MKSSKSNKKGRKVTTTGLYREVMIREIQTMAQALDKLMEVPEVIKMLASATGPIESIDLKIMGGEGFVYRNPVLLN